MNLQTVIGFLLATAFVAAAVFADYRARKLKVTGQVPHFPSFEFWPVPAMPVKVMAILLLSISVVGFVFFELGFIPPNPVIDTTMAFNSFICMGLIAISCLVPWSGIMNQVAAGLALIWATLSVVDSLHDIGWSQLLHHAKNDVDADMAPIAGLCFAAAAAVCLMLGRASSSRPLRYATGFVGVMMFFYGLLALFGYATGNTVVLTFSHVKPVPAAEALLITIMGSGFSSLIYHDHIRSWSKPELNSAINMLTALTLLGAVLAGIYVFISPTNNTVMGALLILGILLVCTGAVGFVALRQALIHQSVAAD